MAFEDVVVRVRSKIGISRLCLTKNSTFGDLKRELNNRINFSDGSAVRLFAEGTKAEIIGPDERLLSDMGIGHGASLFLDQSASEMTYAKIPSGANPRPSQDDMDMDDPGEQGGSVSVKDAAAAPADAKDGGHKEPEGPLFKSFDAYLHENSFAIGDLPLKNSYLPVVIKRGVANKLPLGVTIRHQKYRHVDHLEMMNVEEVRSFANFWLGDLEMSFQRTGWMYGYYTEDAHYPYGIRAVCEAIYEPPQLSLINDVSMLEDPMLPNVDRIARRLGLERIGLIFTRLPNECFMTAKELMRSIEMQYDSLKHVHYTGYPVSTMVTCTMSPDENGRPVLNAFMASDMALALFRDELLHNAQAHDSVIRVRAAQGPHEIMPLIIESGKEVTSFDTSWLLVRINESAPISPKSFFANAQRFPVENRSYSSRGGGSDLPSGRVTNSNERFRRLDRKVLSDYFGAAGADNPWRDFHLLVYVCQVLDVDTALAICDCLLNGEPVDELVRDLLLQS